MPTPRLGDRSLFPDLEPRVYLNHSAVSPFSVPVQTAIAEAVTRYAANGLAATMALIEAREALRADLARFLGAPNTKDVALLPNTTDGVLSIAMCCPWAPRDRVILFDGEFPANTTPWQQAAQLFDLELEWLSAYELATDTERALSALRDALRQGARLVALSAVQFQTGWLAPLERIASLCHAHGAELFVDGVQACGVVPIHVAHTGIDYLACGGHKWMMGTEGAGFLYIRSERMPQLVPRLAGWLSHENPVSFLTEGSGHLRYDRPVRQSPDFLETGTVNALGYAALHASLKLLMELGVDVIYNHVQAYLDALERVLLDRGFTSHRSADPRYRSGILSVSVPDDADLHDVHQSLTSTGIACSIPDGYLRFAPHWPNALSEIDLVAEALDA